MSAYPGGATDSVARGPKRWERAARNAALRPTVKSAQLFFERMATARGIAGSGELTEGPRQQMRVHRDMYSGEDVKTARGWTCSVEHAALYLMLEARTTDRAQINLAMWGLTTEADPEDYTTWTRYFSRPGVPERTVSCRVCGREIRPDGSVEADAPYKVTAEEWEEPNLKRLRKLVHEPELWERRQPEPERRAYYIDQAGNFRPIEELRVIELTERELEIARFADWDARRGMVSELGRPVTA